MRKIHKIMLIMPVIIVWYWLFCVLFFVKTVFYANNFEVLDTIDTFLVGLCGTHFIFFYFIYNRISKIYLSCIYSIVILNFLYIYLTNEIYYFFYYSIIITYILLPLWKKKN